MPNECDLCGATFTTKTGKTNHSRVCRSKKDGNKSSKSNSLSILLQLGKQITKEVANFLVPANKEEFSLNKSLTNLAILIAAVALLSQLPLIGSSFSLIFYVIVKMI